MTIKKRKRKYKPLNEEEAFSYREAGKLTLAAALGYSYGSAILKEHTRDSWISDVVFEKPESITNEVQIGGLLAEFEIEEPGFKASRFFEAFPNVQEITSIDPNNEQSQVYAESIIQLLRDRWDDVEHIAMELCHRGSVSTDDVRRYFESGGDFKQLSAEVNWDDLF